MPLASSWVSAPPKYLPIDDVHPAEPRTPYGAAKRAMELLAERTVEHVSTSW